MKVTYDLVERSNSTEWNWYFVSFWRFVFHIVFDVFFPFVSCSLACQRHNDKTWRNTYHGTFTATNTRPRIFNVILRKLFKWQIKKKKKPTVAKGFFIFFKERYSYVNGTIYDLSINIFFLISLASIVELWTWFVRG